jgi:hypothetical protein
MTQRKRLGSRIAVVLGSLVLVLAGTAAASASSNDQAVLSGTAVSTTIGPGGFWIWSQQAGNAYGNDGAGSMYFYQFGIVEVVEASNVSITASTVSEQVASADGVIVCSSFSGVETSPGLGTVSFSCTVRGHGTAVATNVPAQVNISSGA